MQPTNAIETSSPPPIPPLFHRELERKMENKRGINPLSNTEQITDNPYKIPLTLFVILREIYMWEGSRPPSAPLDVSEDRRN